MRVLALLLLLPALSWGQTAPEAMSYQGYLEESGAPFDGTVNIDVLLYDALTGGSNVWSKNYTNVPVADGIYSLILEDGSPSLRSVVFDRPYFLEVRIAGVTQTPRTPLLAAPYALGLRGLRSEYVSGTYSIVGGYEENTTQGTSAPSRGATISGGGSNDRAQQITASFGTIGGGHSNVVSGSNGTISGGTENTASGSGSTIGGGSGNVSNTLSATIGGGSSNTASGNASTVGGGNSNQATSGGSTVAGGEFNRATAFRSAVLGGGSNAATGDYASVVGGQSNTASGDNSLAFGQNSQARGARSFAGGTAAKANHDGSFVWAGSFVSADSAATSALNQFNVFAAGGMGIGTNEPLADVHVAPGGTRIDTDADDNETLIVDDFTGSLGLYGRSTNTANAIHLGRIDNDGLLQDKWVIERRGTTAPALNFRYGTSASDTGNDAKVRFNSDGSVDADGAYSGAGADYAELLPLLNAGESIEPGDLVGVFAGRISRTIAGADRVMVVSEKPAVLGNAPMNESRDGFLPVAFIGQVRVQVEGPVSAGDYILAAGTQDGRARAVAPADLTIADLDRLAGRAWSTRDADGLVTIEVGLDRSDVVRVIATRLAAENDELRHHLRALSDRVERLETQPSR